MQLSLCMIARDNAATILRCLESVRPWVDEMIVVDTGSVDETPRLAAEAGARVSHFPWCDDFSAARNASLDLAAGQWLFWMDTDDFLPPNCGQAMRELVGSVHDPNTLGYVVQVHCPGDVTGDMTTVDHVKLIRSHPALRFEFRIHEQVLPAIRRLGGDVRLSNVYVVHEGSRQTPEGRKRKIERDLRILELELGERPDHPFALFNLGMTCADAGDHERAVTSLRRCLQVSGPEESHVSKAIALLVASLIAMGQLEAAESACSKGLDRFPDDPELRFRYAMILADLKQFDEAQAQYVELLQIGAPRRFRSVDPGIASYKALYNLASLYRQRGWTDRAEGVLREAVRVHPAWPSARRALVELLQDTGRSAAARLELELLERTEVAEETSVTLEARQAMLERDHEQTRELLTRGLQEWPESVGLVEIAARYFFEQGPLDQALVILERLAKLSPEDGSVWHNLGVVWLRQGDGPRAQAALEQSLRVRPGASQTLQALEAARRIGCERPEGVASLVEKD